MPPYNAAALTMKTRTPRRRSTRSVDHDVMVCVTANAMKPSATRLTARTATRTPDAGAIHMQLTKLNAVTPAHTSACHQRNLNASSNSARVNSQNTTTLPVDSAISGAYPIEIGKLAPIENVTAC